MRTVFGKLFVGQEILVKPLSQNINEQDNFKNKVNRISKALNNHHWNFKSFKMQTESTVQK